MPGNNANSPQGAPGPLRSICVFCGSSTGRNGRYRQAAVELGRSLVERGCRLVYGGGQVGLMGVLADAVLDLGGEVIGVIPKRLATRELLHPRATKMHRVASMHERKAKMGRLSDAYLALPGGYGTLEELLEVITWSQLGIHNKPIGLLNVAGFFRPLVAAFDHAVHEGFIRREQRGLFLVDSNPARLLDALAKFHPPRMPKWLQAEQT
ncbi:MAG: TIGR00730 family Rossman fold protein [Planctomycetia bacterium]|nr:TIGR00730 family Rossman fold protein [Planctomycetia bacterium]